MDLLIITKGNGWYIIYTCKRRKASGIGAYNKHRHLPVLYVRIILCAYLSIRRDNCDFEDVVGGCTVRLGQVTDAPSEK